MKEFTDAVEEVVEESEREEKIAALMARGKSREEAEHEVDEDKFIPFKLGEREMRAYPPSEGQLVFLMAAMGRGQTKDARFASIVNLMLASLREDDREYMESRLLTSDPKQRLPIKKVEEIFEYLAGEWFATPTQPPSDSLSSSQSGGPNSMPPTTPSLGG